MLLLPDASTIYRDGSTATQSGRMSFHVMARGKADMVSHARALPSELSIDRH